MSTEATVRSTVVRTIKEIAPALGLLGTDTIHEFLREYYHPEKQATYLNADLGGKMAARAWGVEVLAITESLGPDTGPEYSRLYQITIKGYYSLVNGSEVNTLIDHARVIRGAIKDLGITLGGQVTLLESLIPFSPSIEDGEGGKLVVGTITYGFLEINPSY